jgi:putative glutamine amidotransferase
MSRPIVVIPSCTKDIGGLTFDAVGRKYSAAVAEVAECQPLLVPLGASLADIGAVLDIADGILLSGSLSNVEPVHYNSPDRPINADAIDRERDAVTLPLIRVAVAKKVPLFAICRGFQEFNVALGGTLHQAVHAVDGHNDHREPTSEDYDIKFGPKHTVKLAGELKSWVGRDQITVNSLHWQGIQKLAAPLVAEAFAEDGLIEAIRAPQGHPFSLGVQWHPEWQPKNNPVSIELFRRFGDAARTLASIGSTS